MRGSIRNVNDNIAVAIEAGESKIAMDVRPSVALRDGLYISLDMVGLQQSLFLTIRDKTGRLHALEFDSQGRIVEVDSAQAA